MTQTILINQVATIRKIPKNQIGLPVISNSEKDIDIQESTQGGKIGSNNKSEMVQDTNRNPNYKNKEKLQPEDKNTVTANEPVIHTNNKEADI